MLNNISTLVSNEATAAQMVTVEVIDPLLLKGSFGNKTAGLLYILYTTPSESYLPFILLVKSVNLEVKFIL